MLQVHFANMDIRAQNFLFYSTSPITTFENFFYEMPLLPYSTVLIASSKLKHHYNVSNVTGLKHVLTVNDPQLKETISRNFTNKLLKLINYMSEK